MIVEGVHINGIYQHFKGDYYRVQEVAFYHEEGNDRAIVIYYRCDENGIFKSIRGEESDRLFEKYFIVNQPFYRGVSDFLVHLHPGTERMSTPRFKFIKQL